MFETVCRHGPAIIHLPSPSFAGLMIKPARWSGLPKPRRRGTSPAGTPNRTRLPMSSEPTAQTPKQLLHLVFGGELKSLNSTEFVDLDKLDIVGIYPNYAEAYKAWKGAAQRTVDNAHVRYFIVHMHRLLEPQE
jgi:hypothetical protein